MISGFFVYLFMKMPRYSDRVNGKPDRNVNVAGTVGIIGYEAQYTNGNNGFPPMLMSIRKKGLSPNPV